MKKLKIIIALLICTIELVQAQTDNGVMRMDEFRNPKKRKIIQIPGFDGFQTLKCDFHMHTVFSDGLVWPTVRLQEIWQEGLDVMAITDHIEYAPHSADVKVNHNRAWELVKDLAAENNIVFIKGTEITRQTPPGHFNAIFIDDASNYIGGPANKETDKQAVIKAVEQKAFIFWNHPGWKVDQIDGSYEWIDLVDELHKEKNLHGIEVFNGFGFHKKALDWCVDKNLTVMGTSDIHNLIVHDYNPADYFHRSMTLVFAKDRTAASVREALEAGRTVAWAGKYIAGKEENVKKLFHACIKTGKPFHSKTVKNMEGKDKTTNYYEITNNSNLYFELELKSGEGTDKIILYPQSSQILTATAGQDRLTYEVVTAFVRSDKHLVAEIGLK